MSARSRLAIESRRGCVNRRLVATGNDAVDHTDVDVRYIGMPAKRLAGEDVGQVHLDEGQGRAGERVAQRDAGMGQRSRIDDDERDGVGGRPLDALDELVLGVALEGEELVTELPGHLQGALLNGDER